MSRTIKLRPQARRDLKKIYIDSVERWGTSRAGQYIFDLEAAFLDLINGTKLSNDASDIKENLQSYQVVSHIAFFYKTDSGLDVIRILHKRMDYKKHL